MVEFYDIAKVQMRRKRTLSGPQSLCGRCVEEQFLLSQPGIILFCSARNRRVAVPTPCQRREQMVLRSDVSETEFL